MPRRSRIHLDGVPLRIVQHGHNRELYFFGEDDYSSYLHWLGEALGETESELHAYVLNSVGSCGNSATRGGVIFCKLQYLQPETRKHARSRKATLDSPSDIDTGRLR